MGAEDRVAEARGEGKARRRRKAEARPEFWTDPYMEAWMALTPAERLRRAWWLRSRLKDIQKFHDEKSLPKL